MGTGTGAGTGTGTTPQHPRMFRVILVNDTRMNGEIVLEALTRFFRHPYEDAVRTMLAAHRGGQASVGIYTREIAETRVAQAQAWTAAEMLARFHLRNAVRLEVVPE